MNLVVKDYCLGTIKLRNAQSIGIDSGHGLFQISMSIEFGRRLVGKEKVAETGHPLQTGALVA